jgi:putative flavoprotein involved in K+ transport
MAMTKEAVDVLIVGGGPAGLAVSKLLSDAGRPHLVLERGRVAENWRSYRWDSFCLSGPNWHVRLPGRAYDGPAPLGYMGRDEIVAWLADYARAFAVPIREGVTATTLTAASEGDGFRVATTDGEYRAAEVVVATGCSTHPRIPDCAADLPADVVHLHSSTYRTPAALPRGAVLVVGSGQSAAQIAEELLKEGRRVYLAAGRSWWWPIRYRGQYAFTWVVVLGWTRASAQKGAPPSPLLTGKDGGAEGGRLLNLHVLARMGVRLLGRLERVEGRTLHFAPDLAAQVEHADGEARKFLDDIDAFVAVAGLAGVPPDDVRGNPDFWTHPAQPPVAALDLDAAKIRTVIWATGYRLDFDWIDLPAFDADGYPRRVHGIGAYPGLYFLGLPGKDCFPCVADDAEPIVAAIAARGGGCASPASAAPRR